MKNLAQTAFIVTIVVTICLLAGLGQFARTLDAGILPDQRIQYYKLYVEIFKAILVGFSVALAGILIPAIMAEARHRFERLRESRAAYSQAKTGFDYLPLRMCTLSLNDAATLVQRVHTSKHMAELYPELDQHLKRRGIKKTPDQWGDNLYNFLYELRHLLEVHANDWNSLSPEARLALIRGVVREPRKDRLVNGAVDPDDRSSGVGEEQHPKAVG